MGGYPSFRQTQIVLGLTWHTSSNHAPIWNGSQKSSRKGTSMVTAVSSKLQGKISSESTVHFWDAQGVQSILYIYKRL